MDDIGHGKVYGFHSPAVLRSLGCPHRAASLTLGDRLRRKPGPAADGPGHLQDRRGAAALRRARYWEALAGQSSSIFGGHNDVRACRFAAGSSTGTNVNAFTTDGLTKSVDVLVVYLACALSETSWVAAPWCALSGLSHRQQPGRGQHWARQGLRLLLPRRPEVAWLPLGQHR